MDGAFSPPRPTNLKTMKWRKPMKKFRNLVICMLSLALVLSMAACGSSNAGSSADTSAPETESTPAPDTTPAPEMPAIEEVENPVTYFSLYMSENPESFMSMSAYDDGMGGAFIEYAGSIRKTGTLEPIVLHGIASALAESGLAELNGRSEYEDGTAMASMYVEFADGSILSADFSGVIAEEFTAGFEAMDAYFLSITAAMPEYVPQAQVMGEVDPDVLAAMQEILNTSGMDGLDMLAISDIAMDEYFAYTAGLSSSEGIANGTSCSAMMMTTPTPSSSSLLKTQTASTPSALTSRAALTG